MYQSSYCQANKNVFQLAFIPPYQGLQVGIGLPRAVAPTRDKR